MYGTDSENNSSSYEFADNLILNCVNLSNDNYDNFLKMYNGSYLDFINYYFGKVYFQKKQKEADDLKNYKSPDQIDHNVAGF